MIALETELVASNYDPGTRTCSYTIARDGKRWTVKIPLADLDSYKANKQARRNHVSNLLEQAMRGPPDPPAGTKDDPFKPGTQGDFDAIPSGAWFVNPADEALHQKP
jgi:hypothetical protein